MLPSSDHLPAMGFLSQCSCQPWQAPLPGGAGSYENTGPISELWSSHGFHPLAIWGNPGPKESWLPTDSIVQNPTSSRGANGNRTPDGSLGVGTPCIAFIDGFWAEGWNLVIRNLCKVLVFSNVGPEGESQGGSVSSGMHAASS